MPPVPRAIDDRIAELKDTLERTRANLVELDGDVTRRTLEAATSLEGRTAEAWLDARPRLTDLWQGQLALDTVLEEIVEVRGARTSLPRATIDRLRALLDGDSVVLAASGPHGGERSLTAGTAPTVHCTIDQVLDTMSTDYRSVTSVVSDVGTVWTLVLGELEALGGAIAALEAEAGAAGGHRPNELGLARGALAAQELHARQDPLTYSSEETTVIAAMVERSRGSIREAAEAVHQVRHDLGAARATLESCRAALVGVRADLDRSTSKVIVAEEVRAELDEIGLELAALERTLDEVDVLAGTQPVEARRSAGEVATRADALRSAIARIGAEGAAGIAVRDELRGRLTALQAKAQAKGRSEDPRLHPLYDQARDELFTAPCDLQRASELVAEFQRVLGSAPTETS